MKRMYRSDIVARTRRLLERHGYPRLQMLFLVLLTGAAGFAASYVLLDVGLFRMWLRYPLALTVAYACFLFLLWLWLRTRAEDYVEIPDFGSAFPSSSGAPGSDIPPMSGGGGSFGGGGASGSFDGPAEPVAATLFSDSTSPVGEVLGAASSADEFTIPLVVIILLLILASALALSSGWIIYSSPELFAELMVDGALTTGLYKRLRNVEPRFWLETAVRRTFLPFLFSAVMLAAAGWGMQHYAPAAHTLGEAIQHAKSRTNGEE